MQTKESTKKHREYTALPPLTRSLKYRRLSFSFRGSLAVHALSYYPCSELALGIKFTSTSHADLGHNLPHDRDYNLGNPIYFHFSITDMSILDTFLPLPSGIYSTAGLSAYMAILSLTSVMGPVLRSTSQRSPQRITAATTS